MYWIQHIHISSTNLSSNFFQYPSIKRCDVVQSTKRFPLCGLFNWHMFPSLDERLPIEPNEIPIPQYKFTRPPFIHRSIQQSRNVGTNLTTSYKPSATERKKNCERITKYLPTCKRRPVALCAWAAANMLRYVVLLLIILPIRPRVIAPNSHPLPLAHEHTFRKQWNQLARTNRNFTRFSRNFNTACLAFTFFCHTLFFLLIFMHCETETNLDRATTQETWWHTHCISHRTLRTGERSPGYRLSSLFRYRNSAAV